MEDFVFHFLTQKVGPKNLVFQLLFLQLFKEGEKLLCNLSNYVFVAFPFKTWDFQKRGKSPFVIYQRWCDNCYFSLEKTKSAEEGDKLLCNLLTGGKVAFPMRYQVFRKRGKSSFVIYRKVICCFFLEKTIFSEEGENHFCNLSKVDIFVFFL